MQSDDANHLLFIEPEQVEIHDPVIDLITRGTAKVLSLAVAGQSYKGWHTCACGAHSGSTELWVAGPNGPVLTNSLAVHYVAYHRHEVPRSELKKMADILYHHFPTGSGELAALERLTVTADQLATPNAGQRARAFSEQMRTELAPRKSVNTCDLNMCPDPKFIEPSNVTKAADRAATSDPEI